MDRSTVGYIREGFTRQHMLRLVAFVVLLCISIIAIAFETHIFSEESIFNRDISSNSLINSVYRDIPLMFTTCQVAFLAMLTYIVIRHVTLWSMGRHRSEETAARLLLSFLKYFMAIITVLTILSLWGVNTTMLVASAGIVSLVVGLGAQSLIADILAGMFIVFEQEFRVGDVITIDGWKGTVQDIGIRCTKIADIGGDVRIVNNSDIKSVINQSRGLSVAKTIVGIDYSESLPRVELVIRDNLDRIRENVPYIVEGPFYKGVSQLGESSVDLAIYAGCEEDDVLDVIRGMNREIKLIFEENDVSIPFPQMVVNEPTRIRRYDSSGIVGEARSFFKEQISESKGLEEED